jgi:hypothetical protein
MALGALSQAWISAEAALPHGWAITGLVGNADAERWVATATGSANVVTEEGGDLVQGLHQLAFALRERPSPGDLTAPGGPTAPAGMD